MSIPQNSLTLREWFALGEELAARNTDIGHVIGDAAHCHFSRYRFVETASKVFDELKSPALLLETPESGGIDNSSNNLLVSKYLAFTIAKRLEDDRDHAERVLAEDECESIAMQTIARLRKMRIHLGGQTFGDVEVARWEGDVMGPPFLNPNWAGYRVMLPVKVNERRLTYDPAKWNDDVAVPRLVDLTAITCANLNDPSFGLTTSQRNTCLLPTYDFSSSAVLSALTDVQRAALAVVFGGEGGECDPVTIVDQDDQQVAEVAAGGEFEVFRFDEIVDDGTDGGDEIIDMG